MMCRFLLGHATFINAHERFRALTSATRDISWKPSPDEVGFRRAIMVISPLADRLVACQPLGTAQNYRPLPALPGASGRAFI